MHKKITLFGIATAIMILAVCIGTAGGAAVAGNAGQTQRQRISAGASAIIQKGQMANVDAAAPRTAADSNYGTPTPAYTNYDAIWTSSGNQFIKEDMDSGIVVGTPVHGVNQFGFTLGPNQYTIIITPFVNSISKTGIHPKVRYLYFELNMPTGVSVSQVSVWSGTTQVYFSPVTWAGTGAVKDYTLDMGSYHDMVRGISTAMIITNSQTSNQGVFSYGAGAKQEW
jgi:hypothetical protein